MIRAFIFVALLYTTHYASTENVKNLTWEMMKELNFETGERTETLTQLENKTVKVAGFIVPLEMDEYIDTVKEFLLVPNPLACIHVPPPPPNQIVYVKMKEEIPLDMDFRGVSIIGIISISKTETGIFGYELAGKSAKEANLKYDDPLMDIIDSYYE